MSAALALVCVLVLGLLRTTHRKDDSLHDPALSTLVFPPESKFQE